MEYTMQEAAAYLGITYASMKNHLKAQRVTPARRIGRSWMFTREELDRLKATLPLKEGRPPKPKD